MSEVTLNDEVNEITVVSAWGGLLKKKIPETTNMIDITCKEFVIKFVIEHLAEKVYFCV